MNFAYWSSCVFTDSSTRAWIVTVFGFLDCDFRIAIGFVFLLLICITGCLTNCLLQRKARGKTDHAECVTCHPISSRLRRISHPVPARRLSETQFSTWAGTALLAAGSLWATGFVATIALAFQRMALGSVSASRCGRSARQS